MAGAACSIPGCSSHVINVRGWCSAHYQRWQRHGDPLAGRTTPHGELKKEMERAIAGSGTDECWVWKYTVNATGYPQLVLDGRTRRVNRVICAQVHGAPPTPAHQAAHSCGNRRCINPHHLSWKTRVENEADKLLHGTRARGEASEKAKLTEAQVRDILRLRASGLTMRSLATQFGVAHSTIQSILERRNWRHLEETAQ